MPVSTWRCLRAFHLTISKFTAFSVHALAKIGDSNNNLVTRKDNTIQYSEYDNGVCCSLEEYVPVLTVKLSGNVVSR